MGGGTTGTVDEGGRLAASAYRRRGVRANAGRASHGAEADVTTRLRTKAQREREGGLMDAVCERGNLWFAYDRVLKNE